MIDFSLTEEQLAFQKTARDFAEKEIKPIAAELDLAEDPERKAYWDLLKKGAQLGFNKVLIPKEYGGLGMGLNDWLIVLEELAVGDIGVTVGLVLLEHPAFLILNKANEDLRAEWLKKYLSEEIYVMGVAATEPDAGGSELSCPIPDPKFGMKVRARKDDEGYVINGAKSAFITNAGWAKSYFVLARTDPSKPAFESTSLFHVFGDTPGISVVDTPKIGWRCVPMGQLILDDVRVPKYSLIGEEGQGLTALHTSFKGVFAAIGALNVGLARAAFEYSVNYAKERITWGQPMKNHQAVAMTLADMQIDIEAARLLAWNAAWQIDTHPEAETTISAMVKVFNTEVAVRTAHKAINILGGYGLTKEYPVEKYLRDALIGPIGDFQNTMWRLRIAAAL